MPYRIKDDTETKHYFDSFREWKQAAEVTIRQAERLNSIIQNPGAMLEPKDLIRWRSKASQISNDLLRVRLNLDDLVSRTVLHIMD